MRGSDPMWKARLSLFTFIVLAAIPEFVPALANYRIIAWNRAGGLLAFSSTTPAMPVTPPPSSRDLHEPPGSLDAFYAALGRPRGTARILHYGDSPAAADQITADVRDLLQRQFGDAGHGFVLIAKPWAWYAHRGVRIESDGWRAEPASMRQGDGLYGLGGVSFTGGQQARSRLRFDTQHDAIEVAYLQQPGGGILEVHLDGRLAGNINTQGPLRSAFRKFEAPLSTIDLSVKSGSVRMFGVEARKRNSGVVYSSLGLNGAYVSVLSKMFDMAHWREQLQHYRPDLVIINYGTNESVYRDFVDRAYEGEVRESIRRIREAVPESSILLVSPMDRGERSASGEISTVPGLPRLAAIQQRIANETGCAFFDTFNAMGGAGTMGRWYAAEPRLVSADFIHPMPAGARVVGNLLYRALTDRYGKPEPVKSVLVR